MADEIESDEQGTEALRMEFENSKERLRQQLDSFNRLGNQGLRMVRISLVFVGLMITVALGLDKGFLSQISPTQCAIFNGPACLTIGETSVGTVLFLSISTLLFTSIIGPEIRGIPRVAQPEDLDQLTDSYPQSEEDYLQTRLREYRDRISHNHRVIRFIEGMAALGGATFAFSILLLSVVFIAVVDGPIGVVGVSIALVVLLGFWAYLKRKLPESYLTEERGIFGRS